MVQRRDPLRHVVLRARPHLPRFTERSTSAILRSRPAQRGRWQTAKRADGGGVSTRLNLLVACGAEPRVGSWALAGSAEMDRMLRAALAVVAFAVTLTFGPAARAVESPVDQHAEVAAALFAASATQAAVERATDAKISAQRAEIAGLAAKVRAGQAKQAELTAAQEDFVAQLAA